VSVDRRVNRRFFTGRLEEEMLTEIFLVSAFGGLLCLDRVFIQTMISRPIVVAPLVGLFFHHVYAGLVVGAIVELIWIDRLPIGTYIPPNDSLTAVLAAATVMIGAPVQENIRPEFVALCVLLAIPFGILAKQMDILIIKANDALSDDAIKAAERQEIQAVERKSYQGLFRVFAAYFLFLLVAQLILIPVVLWGFPRLSTTVIKTLRLMYYFLPLLGIAVAVNMLKLKHAVPVFCTVFLMIAILLEIFHVL